MNRKRSVYNTLTDLFTQLLSMAFAVIVPRFFVLGYGSEINGLLQSVNQVFGFFTLLEAGVGALALQALYRPVAENDRNRISAVLAATDRQYKKVAAAYLGGVLVFCAVYGLLFAQDVGFWTAVGVIFFTGLSNLLVFALHGRFQLLLRAEGKNYVLSILSAFAIIASNAGRLICIFSGLPVVAVQAVFLVINLTQALLLLVYIRRRYPWIDRRAVPELPSADKRRGVMVHTVSTLIFNNTDIIFLTFFVGLEAASVYAFYRAVITIVNGMIGALFNGFDYLLGQTFSQDRARFLRYYDLYNAAFITVTFALYAVALVLYLPFMRLYTSGMDVNYVFAILPPLFVGIELLSHCRTPANKVVQYAGHFRETAGRAVLEMAINLAASLTLVLCLRSRGIEWGMAGLLCGTICALVYRVNDFILYANRRILNRSPLRDYRIVLCNLALFVLCVWGSGKIFTIEIAGYRQFFVWGVILTAIILPLFLLFNALTNPKQTRLLFDFVKSKLAARRK